MYKAAHINFESFILLLTVACIFGPNRDKLAGDWRGPRNEELHKFYASPNIISVIK
jgi:hypothetical protein